MTPLISARKKTAIIVINNYRGFVFTAVCYALLTIACGA